MAMIDLNRVLNQSLSSMRSHHWLPRAALSSGGLNLRGAFMGLLAIALLSVPVVSRAQELSATLNGGGHG